MDLSERNFKMTGDSFASLRQSADWHWRVTLTCSLIILDTKLLSEEADNIKCTNGDSTSALCIGGMAGHTALGSRETRAEEEAHFWALFSLEAIVGNFKVAWVWSV